MAVFEVNSFVVVDVDPIPLIAHQGDCYKNVDIRVGDVAQVMHYHPAENAYNIRFGLQSMTDPRDGLWLTVPARALRQLERSEFPRLTVREPKERTHSPHQGNEGGPRPR